MSVNDDSFREPSHETKLRWQNDKETLGSQSSDHPPPWNVGDRLDGFVLEALLGSGSSGVVYRALDETTNRRCALKLLKQGPPDDLLRNKLGFRRMMSLEHPNLLRVDRIHQLGSYTALSMEEVDGQTLRKAIKELKELEPASAYQQLLKLMRDFAAGLSVMHTAGYIHRDIKPDNLMVDRQGNGRVIDYGLVDVFELAHTAYGARGFLLGTPHYFPPEVLWSQKYLPAGDIFSLGIVMLDAVRSLQRSFRQRLAGAGGDAAETADLKRSDTSCRDDADRIDAAIEELCKSIPSIIREACREMLDRDPAQRPTALQLCRLGLPGGGPMILPGDIPMVGRDREQQQIVDWVDRVFGGEVGRLHVTGPSGIGKSRLIEEVIDYIQSKKWGQVFSARCRVREDSSLQAFDQICDAIAHRYMKGDRDRIELDPVSVGILQDVFPVLASVLTCSMRLSPIVTTSERLDGLEAAARLSDQLRLVGPLFLVIDDSQWADRDSLNVLDRLQTAESHQGLGIITISRKPKDPQRVPASQHVALKPLRTHDSVRILATAAQRYGIEMNEPMLMELAQATGGTPFRVRQLADEFRPGGALASDNGDKNRTSNVLAQMDSLWKQRASRLSDAARRTLIFVVTAGGSVSTEQLGKLTGLDDSVDVAVSELARRRLITDKATGGECIAVYHDRAAVELIKTFSERSLREAHHAWALLLVRQDSPQRWAARIAGHFFAAQEPGRAVAHAILAAEDAERRLAMSEAGRWYARVLDHVGGEEKVIQLRNAARCYYEADFPFKAAELYQQLATQVDEEEAIDCRLMATTQLIKCGRFSEIRDQLAQLSHSLGLPTPKSGLRNQLALLLNRLRLSVSGKHRLLAAIQTCQSSDPKPQSLHPGRPLHSGRQKPALAQGKQPLTRLSSSLCKPLSMLDRQYAAELNTAAIFSANQCGDPLQRVRVAVGNAVLACHDRGNRRIQGEVALIEMKPSVEKLNSAQATGELWAGFAYSHALACRWNHVIAPVRSSVEHFESAVERDGFESAHTRWLELWANWNLGRWKAMWKTASAVSEDAMRRSDFYEHFITTAGFGGNAWLARDLTSQLRRIRFANKNLLRDLHPLQMVHVFDWIASMQTLLYEGRFSEAWDRYESIRPQLRRTPFAKMQLIRVTQLSLGSLTALHQLQRTQQESWVQRLRTFTVRLRREQISYARVLANFYDGLMHRQTAKMGKSTDGLDIACQCLEAARVGARDNHLRPYQLAAEDALVEIQTGSRLRLLTDRMASRKVVRPDRFQRLYTVIAD